MQIYTNSFNLNYIGLNSLHYFDYLLPPSKKKRLIQAGICYNLGKAGYPAR